MPSQFGRTLGTRHKSRSFQQKRLPPKRLGSVTLASRPLSRV